MNVEAPTVASLLTVGGLSVIVAVVTQLIVKAWQPTPVQLDRFGPVLAVLVAVAFGVAAALATSTDLFQAVLTAIVAGAGAMGVHDLFDAAITPDR